MNQEELAEHEQGQSPETNKKQEVQESLDPNLERQVSFISKILIILNTLAVICIYFHGDTPQFQTDFAVL